MAAKGKCPKCKKNVKLDEYGKIAHHIVRVTFSKNYNIESTCDGTGLDPK